jgi:hypothetical protein
MRKITLIPLIICSAMANANPLQDLTLERDPDFAISTEYLQWKADREVLKNSLESKCSHLSKNERALSIKEKEQVVGIVKETLNDPFSADFRNIKKSSEYDECFYNIKFTGQVNSKNQYGGYVGYQRFDIDGQNNKWDNIKYDVDYDHHGFQMKYLEFLRNRNEKIFEESSKRIEARKKSWVCVIAVC